MCAQQPLPGVLRRFDPTTPGAARRVLRALAIGVVFGLLAAWGLGSVKAQEHHPAAMHDKFYSKWNQPPTRETSCCNKDDCNPTKVVIENGICKAWKLPTTAEMKAHWVLFDCALLEENLTDAEESPDGQSHACIAKYTDQVYCAVRGSLQ